MLKACAAKASGKMAKDSNGWTNPRTIEYLDQFYNNNSLLKVLIGVTLGSHYASECEFNRLQVALLTKGFLPSQNCPLSY
jgi:hypothetical protein